MLIDHIRKELNTNNRITETFYDNIFNHKDTKVIHNKLTDITSVCVIVTPYNLELVGYSQHTTNVSDLTKQKLAYENAKSKLKEVIDLLIVTNKIKGL